MSYRKYLLCHYLSGEICYIFNMNLSPDEKKEKKEMKRVGKIVKAYNKLPKIGIFWLHYMDGKIYIFHSLKRAIKYGQKYGSFIIEPKGHYDIWEVMKSECKYFPKNSNYDDLPRGRIAYDTIKKQYVVYHGDYTKSSRKIKSLIKSEFSLGINTRFEPDLHYNGFKRWGF